MRSPDDGMDDVAARTSGDTATGPATAKGNSVAVASGPNPASGMLSGGGSSQSTGHILLSSSLVGSMMVSSQDGSSKPCGSVDSGAHAIATPGPYSLL